jgi:uroporphyrinogen-III synthase
METARPCDLGGLEVLVTRPAGQAAALCHALEAANGRPLPLPLMEIVAAADPATRQRLDSATDYDWLIFVSTNAVEHALPYLPPSRDFGIAAVGRSTARALDGVGMTDILVPSTSADSEGLLAEPALADVAGQRILIVRGCGGRPLLADTLQSRGARVEYAEVYRRELPADTRTRLHALLHRPPGAITITSGEMLENLTTLSGPATSLRDIPLVAVSTRVAELARRAGFRRVIQAGGAGDDAIVATLCEAFAPHHEPDPSA